MSYIDGFVFPCPQDQIEIYRKMTETAGKVWMEHGALAFTESIAEDTDVKGIISFPELTHAGDNETIAFSYIVFKSREHRDEVNAKVMKDPRMKDMLNPDNMPFDCKRVSYGGFTPIVEYSSPCFKSERVLRKRCFAGEGARRAAGTEY